jgi:hypothetical protein
LTRRISPLGGGGGSGLVMLRNMPIPIFQMNQNIARPAPTQMIVSNMIAQSPPSSAMGCAVRGVR